MWLMLFSKLSTCVYINYEYCYYSICSYYDPIVHFLSILFKYTIKQCNYIKVYERYSTSMSFYLVYSRSQRIPQQTLFATLRCAWAIFVCIKYLNWRQKFSSIFLCIYAERNINFLVYNEN